MGTMKVTKEMSLDEVLEAVRAVELLGSVELNLAQSLRDAQQKMGLDDESLDPREKLIKRLQEARVKPGPKKRPKKSWQSKLKKQRARGRRKYASRVVRRNAEWVEMLKDDSAHSWYMWLSRKSNTSWAKRKGWEISEEDFTEFVYPALRGPDGKMRVPSMKRHNTARTWTMKNTQWVVDGEVVFDGAEWYMRKKGYIL